MNRIKLLFCLLLLCLFLGCQLDDSPPLPRNDVELPTPPQPEDYKAPFYGNFAFMSYYWIYSMGNEHFRDTVNFVGNISAWKGSDSLLYIRYRLGEPEIHCSVPWWTVIRPLVLPSGVLHYTAFLHCSHHAMFEGRFIGYDSFHIKMGDGGLGFTEGHVIDGVRIQ